MGYLLVICAVVIIVFIVGGYLGFLLGFFASTDAFDEF